MATVTPSNIYTRMIQGAPQDQECRKKVLEELVTKRLDSDEKAFNIVFNALACPHNKRPATFTGLIDYPLKISEAGAAIRKIQSIGSTALRAVGSSLKGAATFLGAAKEIPWSRKALYSLHIGTSIEASSGQLIPRLAHAGTSVSLLVAASPTAAALIGDACIKASEWVAPSEISPIAKCFVEALPNDPYYQKILAEGLGINYSSSTLELIQSEPALFETLLIGLKTISSSYYLPQHLKQIKMAAIQTIKTHINRSVNENAKHKAIQAKNEKQRKKAIERINNAAQEALGGLRLTEFVIGQILDDPPLANKVAIVGSAAVSAAASIGFAYLNASGPLATLGNIASFINILNNAINGDQDFGEILKEQLTEIRNEIKSLKEDIRINFHKLDIRIQELLDAVDNLSTQVTAMEKKISTQIQDEATGRQRNNREKASIDFITKLEALEKLIKKDEGNEVDNSKENSIRTCSVSPGSFYEQNMTGIYNLAIHSSSTEAFIGNSTAANNRTANFSLLNDLKGRQIVQFCLGLSNQLLNLIGAHPYHGEFRNPTLWILGMNNYCNYLALRKPDLSFYVKALKELASSGEELKHSLTYIASTNVRELAKKYYFKQTNNLVHELLSIISYVQGKYRLSDRELVNGVILDTVARPYSFKPHQNRNQCINQWINEFAYPTTYPSGIFGNHTYIAELEGTSPGIYYMFNHPSSHTNRPIPKVMDMAIALGLCEFIKGDSVAVFGNLNPSHKIEIKFLRGSKKGLIINGYEHHLPFREFNSGNDRIYDVKEYMWRPHFPGFASEQDFTFFDLLAYLVNDRILEIRQEMLGEAKKKMMNCYDFELAGMALRFFYQSNLLIESDVDFLDIPFEDDASGFYTSEQVVVAFAQALEGLSDDFKLPVKNLNRQHHYYPYEALTKPVTFSYSLAMPEAPPLKTRVSDHFKKLAAEAEIRLSETTLKPYNGPSFPTINSLIKRAKFVNDHVLRCFQVTTNIKILMHGRIIPLLILNASSALITRGVLKHIVTPLLNGDRSPLQKVTGFVAIGALGAMQTFAFTYLTELMQFKMTNWIIEPYFEFNSICPDVSDAALFSGVSSTVIGMSLSLSNRVVQYSNNLTSLWPITDFLIKSVRLINANVNTVNRELKCLAETPRP